MGEQSRIRVHVLISGRVQGVGYRAFVYRTASQKGVAGGVRNLPDGRVEVRAEGDKRLIGELVDALKIGPPGARVDDVRVERETPIGLQSDFQIWY